jgi:hypothetical protein
MLQRFLSEYFSPENELNIEMYKKYFDEKINKTLNQENPIDNKFILEYFQEFTQNAEKVSDLFHKLKNK